jgi:hypothetical protein
MRVRISEHVIDAIRLEKDLIFPTEDEMSFENPIVGFEWKSGFWNGFNPILQDGKRTSFKPLYGSTHEW